MKNKVLSILIAVLVCCLTLIPAFAEENFGESADALPFAAEEYTDIDSPPMLTAGTQDDVTAPREIPSQRLQGLVVDNADLLTPEQEELLTAKLEAIRSQYSFEVSVVTVPDTGGQAVRDFTDDFYDYNGYGFGEERDGLMLLLSMENRDWWVSTCGKGLKVFSVDTINSMIESISPDLSADNFDKAFSDFSMLCAGKLDKYGKVSPVWIVIDLVLGFVIAFIIMKIKTGKLKSVNKQRSAANYVTPGSLVLFGQNDRFLTTSVSRVPVQQNSSSGSGSHTSSSGTTHGGTGGHF